MYKHLHTIPKLVGYASVLSTYVYKMTIENSVRNASSVFPVRRKQTTSCGSDLGTPINLSCFKGQVFLTVNNFHVATYTTHSSIEGLDTITEKSGIQLQELASTHHHGRR